MPSTRPRSGGSVESSVTRNSPNTGAASSTSTIADDRAQTAARICEHLLDDGPEDQIAIRGRTTFVPRLRPCDGLTKPFPTKLTA